MPSASHWMESVRISTRPPVTRWSRRTTTRRIKGLPAPLPKNTIIDRIAIVASTHGVWITQLQIGWRLSRFIAGPAPTSFRHARARDFHLASVPLDRRCCAVPALRGYIRARRLAKGALARAPEHEG